MKTTIHYDVIDGRNKRVLSENHDSIEAARNFAMNYLTNVAENGSVVIRSHEVVLRKVERVRLERRPQFHHDPVQDDVEDGE